MIAGASQYLLGTNRGVSSWSALLGSMGFRGGEILDYKPLDIVGKLVHSPNPPTRVIYATMPWAQNLYAFCHSYYLASFKDGTKTNTENSEKDTVGSVFESMSTLGSEMMKRIPYQHILDQDIAQLLGSDFLDSDSMYSDTHSHEK